MKSSLLLLVLLFCQSSLVCQQKPDKSFDASVIKPAFINSHPKVLFDEAHYNMHTSGGTYLPFVNLIRNDGCLITPNKEIFTLEALQQADLLVISNAMGGKHNLKEQPAFTEAECTIVKNWVLEGGALLLVADHYPMGSAAEKLASQFGVHMFNGETADSINFEGNPVYRDKLVFSRENGLLPENEIVIGRSEGERINKVVTDRGQSLSIPENAIALMPLSLHSYHHLPDSIWHVGTKTYTRFQGPFSAYGNCQGLAMKFGKGRVVILGEAAMITAQTSKGQKFGMNTPGNDNKQFALNIVRWLLPEFQ